jgi:hypothetical protein
MNTKKLEWLVYLEKEHADNTLEELRSQFSVAQVGSRQLVILRGSAEQKDQLKALNGVQEVFEGSVPSNLIEGLDLSEYLFVKAWSIRQQVKPKTRPGEGLDWDAEGFEAPGISEDDLM